MGRSAARAVVAQHSSRIAAERIRDVTHSPLLQLTPALRHATCQKPVLALRAQLIARNFIAYSMRSATSGSTVMYVSSTLANDCPVDITVTQPCGLRTILTSLQSRTWAGLMN